MEAPNHAFEFSIREANIADCEAIASGNTMMALETEGKRLDPATIDRGVRAILDDPSKGRYWVAESGGEVIGQIMVTYEWSDWRNGTIWWIQSVFIRPDARRKGVFSALYRHVESLVVNEPGVIGLRLYVEENNKRAQRTYAALGMVSPSYLVMESMLTSNKTQTGGDE